VTPPGVLLQSSWAGLGIVLGLMASLMVAVRIYQVLARPHPELARKMFHMGGGVIASTLPWLVERRLPIVVLGAASVGGFAVLRVVPGLRASLGQVLGGVKRTSSGEFYFLASIVVVFLLSQRAPALFVPPILVLAVADAAAALVGVGYGKVHFLTAEGGRKSAEGSLAFVVAAYLCVHVPLLLWTTTGRAEALLISLNVALVAMMAEAIAWRGLDNLIIPFFVYVFLRTYLPMPIWLLGAHTGVLLGLFSFVYAWRLRTNMAASARVGAVLFGYVVWLLVGWTWLVPPLLIFSTYRALSRRVAFDDTRHINLPIVSSVLLPPLGWAVLQWLLSWSTQRATFFLSYATIFAANLALIALVRDMHVVPGARWPRLLPMALARGAVLLIPSMLLTVGLTPIAGIHVVVGLAAVAIALCAFCLWQPAIETYPLDSARWLRQTVCVASASLLCLLPQQVGAIAHLAISVR
jgi:phytol kinase